MRAGIPRHAGTSVVEALVALLLGLLVLTLGLAVLARQRDAQRRILDRLEWIGAARVTRHVLGTEVRGAGVSLAVHPADSIRLRAFRGLAMVCAPLDPTHLAVAYRGLRLPAAAKDSALVLTASGRTLRLALEAVGPLSDDSCSAWPESRGLTMELSDTVPAGAVLLRIFERGSYHLQGGALRYRRGMGGRQPLTPEVLDTDAGGFLGASSGAVGVVIHPKVPGGPPLRFSLDSVGP